MVNLGKMLTEIKGNKKRFITNVIISISFLLLSLYLGFVLKLFDDPEGKLIQFLLMMKFVVPLCFLYLTIHSFCTLMNSKLIFYENGMVIKGTYQTKQILYSNIAIIQFFDGTMRLPFIKNPETIYCNFIKNGEKATFVQVNSREYLNIVKIFKNLNQYLISNRGLPLNEASMKEIMNISSFENKTMIEKHETKESLGKKNQVWRSNIGFSLFKAILWIIILCLIFWMLWDNDFSKEAKILEFMIKFIFPTVLIILIFLNLYKIFVNKIEVHEKGLYIKTSFTKATIIPFEKMGTFYIDETRQYAYFIKVGTLYTWHIIGKNGKELALVLSSQIYKLPERIRDIEYILKKEGIFEAN